MTPSALIGHICHPNAIWIVTVMCNIIADMRTLVMSGLQVRANFDIAADTLASA
jgi:hypothetical protein